jgi:hypothetical protein
MPTLLRLLLQLLLLLLALLKRLVPYSSTRVYF